jgi:hypothetical protein
MFLVIQRGLIGGYFKMVKQLTWAGIVLLLLGGIGYGFSGGICTCTLPSNAPGGLTGTALGYLAAYKWWVLGIGAAFILLSFASMRQSSEHRTAHHYKTARHYRRHGK